MAERLQSDAIDREVLAGDPQLRDQGLDAVHVWRLDESVPFGGHYLLLCSCGCPGPFVLNVTEARSAVCGIELAWREGAARLSMCLPDLERQGRSSLRHG